MGEHNTITHSDIKPGSWVDRLLVPEVRPYAYLMRLDRPVGAWLLLLPGWWAIVLAAGGGPGIYGVIFNMLVLFAAGAFVMRAAGCIVNDLWDRGLDRQVERTATRPLAAGTVSVRAALILLAILLFCGLMILLQMSLVTVLLGFMTIPLIALYPLMKRWTWWPQAFLGITFNFGALMGWAAVNDVISATALLLYAGGVFWTLGYDTVYAHQDKEDDARIGIRSTALKFGDNARNWVTVFYALSIILIFFAFVSAGAGARSLALLGLAALHLAGQVKAWDPQSPQNSLEVFRSNQAFGLLVLLAAIL